MNAIFVFATFKVLKCDASHCSLMTELLAKSVFIPFNGGETRKMKRRRGAGIRQETASFRGISKFRLVMSYGPHLKTNLKREKTTCRVVCVCVSSIDEHNKPNVLLMNNYILMSGRKQEDN